MLIVLHKPDGILGWLVAKGTRSPYGHVSVWFEDGGLGYQSLPGQGVGTYKSLPTSADLFSVKVNDLKAEARARALLGARYDWQAIAGFLEFSQPQPYLGKEMDCVMFVESVAEAGGLTLLRGSPELHSPRDITLSPHLRPLEIRRKTA